MNHLSEAREVVLLDTEYPCPTGCNQKAVHCLAAIEMNSGREWKLTADRLATYDSNPLPTGDDVIYVAFAAAAEWGSFKKLGWEIPKNCIDLRYEFLRWMNGNSSLPKSDDKDMKRTGLLNALRLFQIHTTTNTSHKEAMRQVCIDHTVLPPEHVEAVVDYCLEDTRCLGPLLNKLMLTAGPLAQVLHRGGYAKVEAMIRWNGLPIDMASYAKLKGSTKDYIANMVREKSEEYPFFYESGEISQAKLARYLIENQMPWDRTPGGSLKTDAETISAASANYPQLKGAYRMARLFASLQDVSRWPIGDDGRCRYFQNPYGTKTSRHAAGLNPFSLKKWTRSLIKPPEGRAIISGDWSSQEIGIAAYKSGDENMKKVFSAAVEGRDVYLAVAEVLGLVQPGAKREDNELLRSRAKVVFLAANYGAGPATIAGNLNVSTSEGRRLLRLYRETFQRYLAWGQEVLTYAMQYGELQTSFGWRRLIMREPSRRHELPNKRSILNFLVQATGADLMRLAAMLCVENGLDVCGTVHDSIVIECDADKVEHTAAMLQAIMNDATVSALGMPSAIDITTAVYPERYYDKDGQADWEQNKQLFGL
jgi:DNA polymerase I